MHIQTLTIENFRSIESVSIELEKSANVIVGPNGIVKTTILEAIRLTKAMLAPRTIDEGQNVLINLGSISPHTPQRINFKALARDVKQQVRIELVVQLSVSEIESFPLLVPNLATAMVQSGLGVVPNGQLGLIQFLSSPEGMEALEKATEQVTNDMKNVAHRGTVSMELIIDPASGTLRGTRQLGSVDKGR